MKFSPRIIAILEALLVTFLWSTSFIIIKWGLKDIPPLTYAGLRYSIAFLALLPLLFTEKRKREISSITKKDWRKLFLLGLMFYAFTQGTQFIGLSLLPSVTVSLILNFTPIIVAVSGIFLLGEKPTNLQWLGSILFIVGILTYFLPIEFSSSLTLGIIVMLIGVIANSGSAILGRDINREKRFSPLIVTTISMGIGAVILLAAGLIIQGINQLSVTNILFLLWLALINTAFAFTLWNKTLRTLTAMESSIINGTMLIQIGVLAWIFLGEIITLKEFIGMLIAACGAVFVQLKKIKNR